MSDVFTTIDAGDDAAAVAMVHDDPQLARLRGGTDGVTPVLYAMYRHRFELAKALADAAGALDLAEAAALDDVAQVRSRLAAGAAVDGRTPDLNSVAANPMRIQPLHAAAAGRHGDVAGLLIDAGAEVNAKQNHGWTPLHSAAANGDGELVDRLVAAGADPAATNDDGKTAAEIATDRGHELIAARLG